MDEEEGIVSQIERHNTFNYDRYVELTQERLMATLERAANRIRERQRERASWVIYGGETIFSALYPETIEGITPDDNPFKLKMNIPKFEF